MRRRSETRSCPDITLSSSISRLFYKLMQGKHYVCVSPRQTIVATFNLGVDAVDVNVTAGAIPEPSMFVPAGASMLILVLTLKRRK